MGPEFRFGPAYGGAACGSTRATFRVGALLLPARGSPCRDVPAFLSAGRHGTRFPMMRAETADVPYAGRPCLSTTGWPHSDPPGRLCAPAVGPFHRSFICFQPPTDGPDRAGGAFTLPGWGTRRSPRASGRGDPDHPLPGEAAGQQIFPSDAKLLRGSGRHLANQGRRCRALERPGRSGRSGLPTRRRGRPPGLSWGGSGHSDRIRFRRRKRERHTPPGRRPSQYEEVVTVVYRAFVRTIRAGHIAWRTGHTRRPGSARAHKGCSGVLDFRPGARPRRQDPPPGVKRSERDRARTGLPVRAHATSRPPPNGSRQADRPRADSEEGQTAAFGTAGLAENAQPIVLRTSLLTAETCRSTMGPSSAKRRGDPRGARVVLSDGPRAGSLSRRTRALTRIICILLAVFALITGIKAFTPVGITLRKGKNLEATSAKIAGASTIALGVAILVFALVLIPTL